MNKQLVILLLLEFCMHGSLAQKKKTAMDSLAMEVDYNNKTLTMQAKYFYYPKTNRTDSVYFSLNPAFTVTEITAPGLKSRAFKPRKDRPFPFHLLRFDKPFDGKVVPIQFNYVIELGKLAPNEFEWIEMMVDQLWFPNATDLDNSFVSHVLVRGLPSDYSLYSYQPFKEKSDHSYVIDERGQNVPEITFLAGKDMTLKKIDTGGISISYFMPGNVTDSTLNSINKKMIDIINYYNGSFGRTKPVKKFVIALRRVPRKIMGSQTTREGFVITGVDFNTNLGNYAHEFGHFWFTGADFIRDSWLNESFANFAMMRALRKFDPEQAERSYNIFKKKAETPGPVSPAGAFDGGTSYDRYYSKGCYLLLQLEEQIGSERMDKLLALRIKKKINTTAGVMQALETVTNRLIRQDFEKKIMGN